MKPFTRIVWKSQQAKDEWNDKIRMVNTVYTECERETVISGMRRATTLHVDINNLKWTFEYLRDNDLVFTPIAQSGLYSGFSHTHMPAKIGKPSYWYGSLTRTVEDGELFKHASNAKDQEEIHTPIGKLLGYPTCCTNTFIELWKTGNYDGMYEIACKTDGINIIESDDDITCNIYEIDKYSINSPLLRYFGLRAMAHFPCELKCKESRKVAKKWLSIMNTIDSDAVNYLEELLSSIKTWDSLNGVVEVNTDNFIGITNTYPYAKKRIINFK